MDGKLLLMEAENRRLSSSHTVSGLTCSLALPTATLGKLAKRGPLTEETGSQFPHLYNGFLVQFSDNTIRLLFYHQERLLPTFRWLGDH